jgi:hypothetical protein
MKPTVLFCNSNAVVIKCSLVPKMNQHSAKEESDAKQLEETVCKNSCGFWKDAAQRNKESREKSGGKKDFKLLCMHPESPYLNIIVDQLTKKGNL